MTRYCALLRGINVGGHRVSKDHLRSLFEALDFPDVDTFLASGNVVFSSPAKGVAALEARIEGHLQEALGYAVPTLVRSLRELARLAASRPSAEEGLTEADSVYVLFLPAPADAAMRSRFAEIESDVDRFRFRERAVYWLIRGKLSESPLFGPGLAKAVGSARHTVRNLNTVERLVQRYGTARADAPPARPAASKTRAKKKR